MEHYLTNSQPWAGFRSSNSTRFLLIPFLGVVHPRRRRYLTVLKSESRCVIRSKFFKGIYHSCSIKSARTTRSVLTNTSVLTWRGGINLHDAYATPRVIPNEVANDKFALYLYQSGGRNSGYQLFTRPA